MSDPKPRSGPRRDWDDDEAAYDNHRRLTAEEAAALRARNPQVSAWQVIAAQVAVGGGVAMLAWLVGGGRGDWAWSALYGAVTAVVPGVLLARGMTSRLASLSPAVSAVSVMLWETVKIAASVALLALAPKLIRPLSWPALLAGLAACLSVYWFALLWRGSKKS